jgi:hypothetical protein
VRSSQILASELQASTCSFEESLPLLLQGILASCKCKQSGSSATDLTHKRARRDSTAARSGELACGIGTQARAGSVWRTREPPLGPRGSLRLAHWEATQQSEAVDTHAESWSEDCRQSHRSRCCSSNVVAPLRLQHFVREWISLPVLLFCESGVLHLRIGRPDRLSVTLSSFSCWQHQKRGRRLDCDSRKDVGAESWSDGCAILGHATSTVPSERLILRW